MARWTPNKLGLASQLPEGSEDVAFKKTPDGPTIAKAHTAVLANQSKEFHGKFYPIPQGRVLPIILCDWTIILCDKDQDCELALKTFVKILYGVGPNLASLDFTTLMTVHSLASHYDIPGLMTELCSKIGQIKIPLSEIPGYITVVHQKPGSDLGAAVRRSIEKTIKSIPGKVRIIKTPLDLSFLKEHLGKNIPTGTNLDDLLDAYKKFLALKVICGDISVPQKFSPSPLVDQVWHAHMMCPRLYRAACAALMGPQGGDLIDHDPNAANDDPAEKSERLRRTKAVYQILFGHEAPNELWQSFTSGDMELFLECPTGRKTRLLVDPKQTVKNLKLMIQDMEGIPPYQQTLLYDGMRLYDDHTLIDCNIQKGSIVDFYLQRDGC